MDNSIDEIVLKNLKLEKGLIQAEARIDTEITKIYVQINTILQENKNFQLRVNSEIDLITEKIKLFNEMRTNMKQSLESSQNLNRSVHTILERQKVDNMKKINELEMPQFVPVQTPRSEVSTKSSSKSTKKKNISISIINNKK